MSLLPTVAFPLAGAAPLSAVFDMKLSTLPIPRAAAAALLSVAGGAACSALSPPIDIRPPSFSEAEERPSELRARLPSADRPLGGAAVRLWARVANSNDFGLSVTEVAGDLLLEDADALAVEFPLGLPLAAGADTIIPLDVLIDFEDLPGLAQAVAQGVLRGTMDYRLDATITVDAGLLGQPRFGPMTALSGTLRVRR